MNRVAGCVFLTAAWFSGACLDGVPCFSWTGKGDELLTAALLIMAPALAAVHPAKPQAAVSSKPPVAKTAPAAPPAAPDAAAPPASGNWESSWIVIGQDQDGAVWLVKAGDMANRTNFRPLVWVTKDHSRDRSTKARVSRSLQLFDCMEGTADVRATIGLSARGAVLWSVESMKSDPKPIVASSIADLVRKSVCPKIAPEITRR